MYTKSGIEPEKLASVRYFSIDRATSVLDTDTRLVLDVDISGKIKPQEWEKLPWLWIVERTI